jgi:hypothetical protein
MPGRAWFKNQLWTSELESGYSSELFPLLRSARLEGDAALDAALAKLLASLGKLAKKS